MKQATIEIFCCPLCKGQLELQTEIKSNKNIIKGNMVCSNCNKNYSILDGIPLMYIPDNEIITLSNISKFSKLIITPRNLDKWIETNKPVKISSFIMNRMLTKFLVFFGWILFFSSILTLSISYLNSNVMINDKLSLLVIYLIVCTSITLFVIDYFRYRTIAKINYLNGLNILKKLSDKQKLSEYNIRIHKKDKQENYENEFENQKKFVSYKSNKIKSILNSYNFRVKKALNIGCGGALHKHVSEPYFDKGYDMMGIDINYRYLQQFNKIFGTDVVQANSMAIPFRDNIFDLINFTDIIEHLHHPLLGLNEAQRVLKEGGVIILTTNNHCVFSLRCINPLVFIEKIISLYYDRILPPRNILGRWMDFNFYHTEFSKNEITKLIKAAGFDILSFKTQFPNKDKLNRIFIKLPVLKSMGREFIIIGKKKIS